MNHPELARNRINQKQLANYWGISERTLERWRSIGWGPIFIKIGGRVVYRAEDILEYEDRNMVRSTTTQSLA